MPRAKRICPAGEVFHVLNRSVARLTLFEKPDDYTAFMRVVEETWQKNPLPIFAMSVMPNHWHFVVRPRTDTQLTDFFRRLTVTHTMRWHAHYATGGTGHLYQGRFKSFPIQSDEHLLTVMRYVERNLLRANLVKKAKEWSTAPPEPGTNGHFTTVITTRYESHPKGFTVNNVEVEDFHNYFVAANGYRDPPVLAHNTCGTSKKFSEKLSDRNPVPKVFREAYEDINIGNGSRYRRLDGNQKVFNASELKGISGSTRNKWANSLEYEIPGTKHRILQRPDGALGYVFNHDYRIIKIFPGPWYPDGY